jgi:hypothetical protein
VAVGSPSSPSKAVPRTTTVLGARNWCLCRTCLVSCYLPLPEASLLNVTSSALQKVGYWAP